MTVASDAKDRAPRLHFLDGLRGWAALAVLLSHLFQAWLIPLAGAHLLSAINYTPLGVMMDGAFAVYIFFGISGFALSYPVMVSKSPYQTLAGLALTRYTRLTIPIVASCLFVQALWSSGLLFNARVGHELHNGWLSYFYSFTPLPGEIWRFALHDVYFAFNLERSWNSVLWTMSIEWYGSFYLFALLLIPFRWTRVLIAAYVAYSNRSSEYFGFFYGYLLAEASIYFGWLHKPPTWSKTMIGLSLICTAIVMAILGRVFILNMEGPLRVLQFNLTVAVGMLGIVLTAPAKAFLSNGLSRFLGGISFSLYLMHLPIIFSFGCGLYLLLTPIVSPQWMWLAVGLPTIAAAICVSMIFRALVEDRAVIWVKHFLLRVLQRVQVALLAAPIKRLRFLFSLPG